MANWFAISGEQILGISLSAFLIYVLLLIFVRINGLRSFSKMSSYEFAITVAVGSILAAIVVQEEPSISQGAWAIAVFFSIQSVHSIWRRKRPDTYLENKPLLLMQDGEILETNLEEAKMTQADLMGKLREANVLALSEVRAVIFEPTGDVSVLHGDKNPDEILLKDVRRAK